MKKFVGLVVVIVVLGGVWFGMSRSKKTPTETKNTKAAEIKNTTQVNQEVVLTDFAFTPKEFTSGSSQTIKVLLKNTGTTAHTFTFDALDFNSGVIEAGQSKVVTFTTPSAPGRYDFYCSQADHKDKGMVGTMVVK